MDFIQNVTLRYSLVVELSFHGSNQPRDALGDSECPESLVLIWAGWEDWCILCHEMVRLMQCLINLLSTALEIEKLK